MPVGVVRAGEVARTNEPVPVEAAAVTRASAAVEKSDIVAASCVPV